MDFEKMPNPSWPTKVECPAGHPLARLGPGFGPPHLLVLYSLSLYLSLDIMKICMDFGPYDAFPSSNVPKKVDQQNSGNSLVISIYLPYLEWNVGMLAVNICILWLPTLGGQATWPAGRVEHLPLTFSTDSDFSSSCRHVATKARAKLPQTLASRPRSWASQSAPGPTRPGVWPTWTTCQTHLRGDDDFGIWSTSLCHPLKCSNFVAKFLKLNKH
jgi:hypothetical protein